MKTLGEKRFEKAHGLVQKLLVGAIMECTEIVYCGWKIDIKQIGVSIEDREIWVEDNNCFHFVFDNSSEYEKVGDFEKNFREDFKLYKSIRY